MGGLTLGKSGDELNVSRKRRTAFDQALNEGHSVEMKDSWKEESAIFRYVPYKSEYDSVSSKHKVVEIIYNDHELQTTLRNNKQIFIAQLLTVLIIISIIAFIIHRWVAKQVYFAYHDSLTKLKNRAALDEYI